VKTTSVTHRTPVHTAGRWFCEFDCLVDDISE
jgi:hypothetical protein